MTGTFYPHTYLRCQWECYLNTDQNRGTGDSVGVDRIETSEWVNAHWLDYTKAGGLDCLII